MHLNDNGDDNDLDDKYSSHKANSSIGLFAKGGRAQVGMSRLLLHHTFKPLGWILAGVGLTLLSQSYFNIDQSPLGPQVTIMPTSTLLSKTPAAASEGDPTVLALSSSDEVAAIASAVEGRSDHCDACIKYVPIQVKTGVRQTRDNILEELYNGDDPFKYTQTKMVDNGYPHTNVQSHLFEWILDTFKPEFWLEIGSMLGGSAIMTAKAIKDRGMNTSLVCIDPFTGDVNMLEASVGQVRDKHQWTFLDYKEGRPSIYERFRANVVQEKVHDVIIIIIATSLVGMSFIKRLIQSDPLRIHHRPQVIFLDSAHEKGETYLEVTHAWDLLPSGGVLVGDDWPWEGVSADVKRFAAELSPDGIHEGHVEAFKAAYPYLGVQEGNVCLWQTIWFLFKP